jgi:flagellin
MDLFKIGSNTASMNALRNLYSLNEKMNVHQSRLATGKRVNNAQEDSAAFAVAKSVETTTKGYNVSLQQVKNAKSVLTIVEAGQQKQLELLQSIKEKVIQIQDATLTSAQRTSIKTAIDQLKSEMDVVGDQMTFNGTTVASCGGTGIAFRVGAGTGSNDSFTVTSSVYTSASSGSITAIASSAAGATSGDITTIDTAINDSISRIANTGAAIERLNHKEDVISVQVQNHEAVRSTYEDADFALEQMELMKVQILQQTATAALAQANSAPQLVLSLFR